MKRILLTLAIAIPTLLAGSGCSGGGDDGDDTTGDDGDDGDDGVDPPDAAPADGPSACANLSGSWTISGQCGADLCTISQTNCDLTSVSCVSGANSTSGQVTGNMFSYTGESGGGVDSTCSGTVSGDTMTGSCTVGIGTCTFTGTR
jgi:hypothetical protein